MMFEATGSWDMTTYKDTILIIDPDRDLWSFDISRVSMGDAMDIAPLAAHVMCNAEEGDQLTYNGRRWVVTKRKGIHFPADREASDAQA